MFLAAGTRLGPYEILAPLGAGGMGEVYRARDPRLNRLIAIKVLPGVAATDAERRERFEREAHAIAALNHPNIVTIYSVEQVDGQSFITMELVAGRSLAEMMPKSGLPLDRLLKIAIPVADAMAAAHQKGITHRDLKPANIMLGEGEHDGRVKVLDFGLAKLAEAPVAGATATALPTAPITGEGRILGTVAYMSPEQAEGKPIDARSDLFSVGVTLYEMATGQRPFTGDTSISIISSIIKDTPKSVTEVNAALPRDLGRIVRRALVKDPTRRYQTAADLRNDLEELKASLDSGDLLTHTAVPSRHQHSRQRLWRWAALAIALVSFAAIALLLRHRPEPTATTSSIDSLQITQLTTSGTAERPAIAPDGKYVAYIQHDGDAYSVWIRQIATASHVQIVPPERGTSMWGATVTPDGGFVDVVRVRQGDRSPGLWRVPFLGGTPRMLIDNVAGPPGWSPDGQHVAFLRPQVPTSTALVVADGDGSHEREVAVRRLPSGFINLVYSGAPSIRPAWSPDGHLVALLGLNQLVAIDVSTGSERVLSLPFVLTSGLGLAWLDSGSLVVSRATEVGAPTQLWRLAYPGGQLSRLTNDLSDYACVSLTADGGSLATSRSDVSVAVWVGDGSGTRGAEVVSPTVFRGNADAARVAWAAEHLLHVTTTDGHASIVTGVPGRGEAAEEIVGTGMYPAASSDGRTIVFAVSEAGERRGLWKVDADGRHAVHLVSGQAIWPVVTADDRQVVFTTSRSGVQSPWIVSIDGGPPTQLANVATSELAVSRDGRLAFASQDAQNRRVFVVCDLPACTTRKTVMARMLAGGLVRWMPDGRSLAYLDAATRSNLWMQPLDGSSPHQFTHFTGRTITDFAWSRDGQRLAISRATIANNIVLFKGLRR